MEKQFTIFIYIFTFCLKRIIHIKTLIRELLIRIKMFFLSQKCVYIKFIESNLLRIVW